MKLLIVLMLLLSGCSPPVSSLPSVQQANQQIQNQRPYCTWNYYQGANARFNGVHNGQAFGYGDCPPGP